MSQSQHYDLLVIGAGSGGVRAARMSSSLGAKVAVIEERFAGGTCVNIGCVPKKLFVHSADLGHHLEQASGYGWLLEQKKFSWGHLRDAQLKEVDRLQKIYRTILEKSGVQWIAGHATFVDSNTLAVGTQTYTADKILIATGSRPNQPHIPGINLAHISDQMFSLPELPKSAVILGGGYIAVEFAGILKGFGVDVSLLIRKEKILSGFDEDVRSHLQTCLQNRGIRIFTTEQLQSIEKKDEQLLISTDKSQHKTDFVLNALGRVPLTDTLGLEKTQVTQNKNGTIFVDPKTFQTKDPSVYAVGDVTGGLQLTPVALSEGMSFAYQNFAQAGSYNPAPYVPTAVFSQPEVGTIGLSEHEALQHHDVDIYTSSFKPLSSALSGETEKIFMKVIADHKTQIILGMHMVGPHSGEIMQGFAVGMNMNMTKQQLDSTIGIHPSTAEEFVTMRDITRTTLRG